MGAFSEIDWFETFLIAYRENSLASDIFLSRLNKFNRFIRVTFFLIFIGKTMAMYALKVFACNLLQRFEIDADGKVETFKIKMDISVRPVDACRVRVKKRVWKM